MAKYTAEGTLFRPAENKGSGGGRRGGGGGGGRGSSANDDDELQISLTDRIKEAARAARRRKGLTVVVVLVSLALTVAASILAPRSYEVESRILVARTQTLQGGNQGYVTEIDKKDTAKEYEEQVKSRDNIVAIVKQTDLVERWNAMRQPHRKLLDRLGALTGGKDPTDEEKFDQLVKTIEAKLRVGVEGTTVSIYIEWAEPEAARDIVAAAVKNFQDARYQIEVGVIPEKLRILEGNAKRVREEVNASFNELQNRQAAQDPGTKKGTTMVMIRPRLPNGGNAPEQRVETDNPTARKLALVRQQIAEAEGAQQAKVAQLQGQLSEKKQTLGEQHPEMISLRASVAAAQQESPQLAALRTQEKTLRAELEANPPQVGTPAPANPQPTQLAVPVPAEPEHTTPAKPKSLEDVRATFDQAQRKYEALQVQLETARIELQTAEAAFKHRYQVVRPAEAPFRPKRPSGLIAFLCGIAGTIAAALIAAALADRFSGIFFEARDVRDRLGLPVFATMRW